MPRSLSLALHLLLAGKGGARGPGLARPARPAGRMVWLRAGAAGDLASLELVAEQLDAAWPDIAVLVTVSGLTAPDPAGFPPGCLADADPGDAPALVRAFLAHWRPDAVVLAGDGLAAAILAELADRGLPVVLAGFRGLHGAGLLARRVARSLLSGARKIFVPDADAALYSRDLLGQDGPVQVSGRIERTADPLGCNAAEREAVADMIGTRPVWCAMGCPLAEVDAVLAAQSHAQRLAHRLVLVLVPADPEQAGEVVERCAEAGLVAAQRSHDEEVTEDVQVLIADTEGEEGLWYRLAPVTFVGGSLLGKAPQRSLLEPAALGSAIICGPKAGPEADNHARLSEARALRLVRSPQALSEAVADLIAPDRAALLAHNAWVSASGGTEAAHVVAEAVATLALAQGKAA
jgi:3-deoxy-D-manno-octulosonic-acid transferase